MPANSTGEGKGLSAEQGKLEALYPHFDPKTHVVTICEHSPITAEMVKEADACWSGYGPGTWSEHLAKVLNRLQGSADSALRLKLERLITGLLDNDGCYSCRNTVQVTGSTVPNMVPHVQRLLCAEHEAKRKFADELSTLLTEDSSQVGKKEDSGLRESLEEQFRIEGWNVKVERQGGLIHAIVYAVRAILEQRAPTEDPTHAEG